MCYSLSKGTMAELDNAVQQVVRYYMNLRPHQPKQLEALYGFVSGRDTFVALPTGYGKSVIFAVLPLLFDKLLGMCFFSIFVADSDMSSFILGSSNSIVLVVTPLISLMIDQREKFTQKGLTVEFVGKVQKDEEAVLSVLNGRVQLVYISPESLLGNARFRAMMLSDLYQKRLRALVVDEAHCVKLWLVKHDICITVIVCFPCRGDDFRVLFAEIGDIRGLIPKTVKILALTATATRETLECVKS